MLAPEILFEDPNLIVLSKPAGLLSQGDRSGSENIVDWLRTYLDRHYVGLVHRLDRNVSGVMVVAKRTKAARRLTRALQTGEMRRSYLGWVVGALEKDSTWQHWLLKDSVRNQAAVVKAKCAHAKVARLTAKPVRKGMWKSTRLTLVSFALETGRSHQIRVQSAYEGYPLLGDPKYGNGPMGFARPALHSSEIVFPHPISGAHLSFTDELPDDMKAIGMT